MVTEISEDNYYSVPLMSVSMFKQFVNCEKCAMEMWDGNYKPEPTKAMKLGSYVDAYWQGTKAFSEYTKAHADEIYKKNGTPYAEYEKALFDCNRVGQDPLWNEYLTGDKQTILTGEIGGMRWKGKPDIMTDSRIVDVKYMRSTERIAGQDLIHYWRYHWQLWVYQELAYQKDKRIRDCFLAIVTKEDPADYEIVHIGRDFMSEAKDEMEKHFPRVRALINHEVEPMACGRCEFCRKTKRLKAPIEGELLGLNAYERGEIE